MLRWRYTPTETLNISMAHYPWGGFSLIPDSEITISRRRARDLGLPSNDAQIAYGNVKYHADASLWECEICQKISTKYNRRQIINHVNAKRTSRKSKLRTRTERVTHVANPDGAIHRVETITAELPRRRIITNSPIRGSASPPAQNADIKHN